LLAFTPAPALAKSFSIPRAAVTIELLSDGSLQVTERLDFAFSGVFQGANRDIPLLRGEAISDVVVSENGTDYQPGAPTALGSSGDPGSYGVEERGSEVRVVWHYRASDEERTFVIRYRISGATVIYDDVVDVNWKVWGDEWDLSVGLVEAELRYPGTAAAGEVYVFGHPATVDGTTNLGDDGVTPAMTAFFVPERTFVELRVVLPRSVLTATTGGQVVGGTGLDSILREEQAEVARTQREGALLRSTLLGLLVLLALVPAALAAGYLIYGRERRAVGYDREYEQAPPSDLEPTMVNALMNQGRADEQAFTAVLFDLIRRDLLTAQPTSVEKKTWLGLRRETISDLEIGLGSLGTGLTAPEARVRTILQRVLEDGPLPLSEFRTKLREDADANHDTYVAYQKAAHSAMVRNGLLDERGKRYPWMVLGALAVVVAVGWFVVAPWLGRRGTQQNQDLARAGLLVVAGLGAGMVVLFYAARRLWVRLSPEGALLAARWRAFRRYLSDFSRMEEAPPMSLPLWEEYLVYGVALGVATEVLVAARFVAPEALVETSQIYWYSHQDDFGGHSSNAIEGISRSLSGAFAAPSSGGGGGFSGGGGGGSGGGGGGAW
jgi:uncharacterized membrane protein